MSADLLIRWDSPASTRFADSRDSMSRSFSMDFDQFTRTRKADFNCMALSSDGVFLAAGTVDRIITVWDVATTQVVSSLPGHSE